MRVGMFIDDRRGITMDKKKKRKRRKDWFCVVSKSHFLRGIRVTV